MKKCRLPVMILSALLVLSLLYCPAFFSVSAAEDAGRAASQQGEVKQKDEVVYALLRADGRVNEIYVVNVLDVVKPGLIKDYGEYTQVKNLTDLSQLEQKGRQVWIQAPEGKYYYQGRLEREHPLPWQINISYHLNGREISPDQLVGRDGRVQITIHITADKEGDPLFFENYIVQTSLTLDAEKFDQIETSQGSIVNVGKNKQVTFTLLPGQAGELGLEADVVDFELEGIEIAALPSILPLDAPDIDQMSNEMSALTKAIWELRQGTAQLKEGMDQLHGGLGELQTGSERYKDGLSDLSNGTPDLMTASKAIGDALKRLDQHLSADEGELDLGQLSQLPAGLKQMGDGLLSMATGLTALKENVAAIFTPLAEALQAIPAPLEEGDLEALYFSGADTDVLDQLLETYRAAQEAKAIYLAAQEGLAQVEGALGEMEHSAQKMGNEVNSLADQLSIITEEEDQGALVQLQKGVTLLSEQYGEFHHGLVRYLEGVEQLADAYADLHQGIEEMIDGAGQLADGAGALHQGTGALHEAIQDLPEEMAAEIDEMMAQYDRSDFEPVSFVSPENEKINSVQFLFKIEGMEKEEVETEPVKEEKEKSFWSRLMDLFRF